MPQRGHSVLLGETDLGRHRHVCLLIEDSATGAGLLTDFVIERLAAGDRVIYVGAKRHALLARFRMVTDLSEAVSSGQLDLRTWDQSYLSSGRFSAARQLTYVRRALREGPSLGFRSTRLIGDMAWAQEDVPGVDELVAYEREVDAIAARPGTSIVCVYDVRRHSEQQIADVRAAHQASLVRGRLVEVRPQTFGPRQRILAAAAVLFAENGITRTGVDTLIEASGVAKATFYRHFPSKDDLIVAWLRHPRTRWFDRVRAEAESRATSPAEVIPRFFDAVSDWVEADDFVGCPYMSTALELAGDDPPSASTAREHIAEIGRFLESQVRAAGRSNAAELGRQLHALLAGAISLAVLNRSTNSVRAARDVATRLLDTDDETISARRRSRSGLDRSGA
jgi:AcrR family transcriptional regulator